MELLLNIFLEALLVLVPMVLSLTVHEYAHALAAKKLGDDTAEGQGRLNLNPLSHADPVGTFFLPLVILMASGAVDARIPFFGWAKPVPVSPARFTRKLPVRTSMMIVAAAGPLSNLALAAVSAGAMSVMLHGGAVTPGSEPIVQLLNMMLGVNISLFLFNLIPLYPLDGQKVMAGLLSGESARRFELFSMRYGSLALLFLVFFAHRILSEPYAAVRSGILTLVGL